MSKHTHKDCEHKKTKYCKKCDVIECESCGEEWGKENTIINPITFPCPLPDPCPIPQWYDTGTGFTPSPYKVYF